MVPFWSKMASTSSLHFSWCSGYLARLYSIHAMPRVCVEGRREEEGDVCEGEGVRVKGIREKG